MSVVSRFTRVATRFPARSLASTQPSRVLSLRSLHSTRAVRKDATIYVDSVLGDDANDGSEANPVQTEAGFDRLHAENQRKGINTLPAEHAEHTSTFTEIVSQYGALPMTGLVFATLMNKEIILLDPEVALFGITGTFIGAAYVAVGRDVSTGIQSIADTTIAKWNSLYDMEIAWLDYYKNTIKWQMDYTALCEQQVSEYEVLMAKVAVAQDLNVKHKARDAMVGKLQTIKAQEDAHAANERERMIEKVVSNVEAAFQTDKKLGQEAIDVAITMIGSPKATSAKDDPVKRAFAKELGIKV